MLQYIFFQCRIILLSMYIISTLTRLQCSLFQRTWVRAPANHNYIQLLFYETMNRSWCTMYILIFRIKKYSPNSVRSGEISSHVVLYVGGGGVYLTHWPTHTRTHSLSSVLAVWRGAWQLWCWGSVVWCDPDCEGEIIFVIFLCIMTYCTFYQNWSCSCSVVV